MPTLTVTHSAGPTVTKTFSVADQDKFLAWWRATRPLSPDTRTDADVLNEWCSWVIVQTFRQVRAFRASNAGTAAAAAEPEIILT